MPGARDASTVAPMSSRVLIVYGSTHGHTAKIADEIGRAIRDTGLQAEAIEVGSLSEDDLARFDGVVVGASIHGGRHQRELVDWARLHAGWLEDRPSVFFSVCLTAAEAERTRRRARRRGSTWPTSPMRPAGSRTARSRSRARSSTRSTTSSPGTWCG